MLNGSAPMSKDTAPYLSFFFSQVIVLILIFQNISKNARKTNKKIEIELVAIGAILILSKYYSKMVILNMALKNSIFSTEDQPPRSNNHQTMFKC